MGLHYFPCWGKTRKPRSPVFLSLELLTWKVQCTPQPRFTLIRQGLLETDHGHVNLGSQRLVASGNVQLENSPWVAHLHKIIEAFRLVLSSSSPNFKLVFWKKIGMLRIFFSGRETCSWWLPQQGEEEGKRVGSSFFSYSGFRLGMLISSEELFLVAIQTLGG